MNVLNSVDVIIGVDTHRDTHTAAFVERTGAVLQMLTFPATPAGYAKARKAAAKWPNHAWAMKRLPLRKTLEQSLTPLHLSSSNSSASVRSPRQSFSARGHTPVDVETRRHSLLLLASRRPRHHQEQRSDFA